MSERIFGGILPYEAEVAAPNGPRTVGWVLADYADQADAIFQTWLIKHDAQVATQTLRKAAEQLDEYNSTKTNADLPNRRRPQFEHAVAWLRGRADFIEKGGQP